MTNIVVLNTETHKHLRVQAVASARYGDAQRFVPVAVNEFSFLVPHYPIFFAKDSETGSFYCGAMLGIDEGENLFLADSGGMESYRPLNLQRGPSSRRAAISPSIWIILGSTRAARPFLRKLASRRTI